MHHSTRRSARLLERCALRLSYPWARMTSEVRQSTAISKTKTVASEAGERLVANLNAAISASFADRTVMREASVQIGMPLDVRFVRSNLNSGTSQIPRA